MIKFSNENILILIVDDTPKNLQVLGSLLSTEKYRIAFAKSGKDALEFAVKQLPNLILLDIMMPNMDGFEVCKRLKEDQKTMDIPIIFLTSLNDEYNEEKGLSLGAVDYITKPFRPIIVKARVENSLKLSCSYNEIKKHKLELEKSIEQLKASEEKLKESKNRIHSIFRSAPVGIGLLNNRILAHVNNRLCEMTGYLEGELINQSAEILYPTKEDYEYVGKEKYKQIEKAGTGTVETHFKRKDGKIIDVLLSSTPIDLENLSKGVTFTALDISERKQVEQAVFEEKIRFKKTLDSIDAGVYVADMDTYELLFVNKQWEDLIGNKLGQKCYLTLQKGQTKPCEFCTNHLLLDNEGKPNQPYVWEFQNTITKLWHQLRDQAIPWTDGKLVRIEIATDITERKEAEIKLKQIEQALKESEAKFKKLSNLTFEGIVLHQNGIISDLNLSFAKIFGYTHEELIGKNVIKLLIKEECHDIMLQAMIAENVLPYEVVGIRKDGTEIPIELETRAIESDNLTIRVMAVRVISERKKFQKELQKRNKELTIAKEKAEAGEAKFRTIIETSPDAISITSLDGTVQFVSAQTVAMWGYTHENEIIGRNQTDFVRSDYHEKAARSIGGMFIGNFVGAEEYVMIRKDGSEFFCEANSNLLYNEKGEPESILIIKRDITDRKNEELKKSEIRFRALHNASFGGIAIHDMGIIKECNQGLSHISGYTLDELIGMDSLLCIAEDSRKTVSQHIKASYEKPYEVVGLRKNGEEYTLRLESKVIPYEGKNMHVAEFRDITEQKQTEIELKIANHNLEQLNIHQNEIREKERKAISREIHDELGQSLSALNIDMGWIADRFKDEKDVNEKLEGMINLTLNTITTVQRISYDLRPGLLDDLGLIPASEWYCQEFVKRTGISCDFNGIENNVSNENIDIALYRILQEGLTNILRHAKATKTSVKLTHTNSNIILKISDNGIGMDIKQLNSNQSLGFIGIKERIKALNGKFQVLTTKNKGTKLIATIPTI